MTTETHSEHTIHEHDHKHGSSDCTHETVEHGDHTDYLHDGHRHAEHGDHYDEH
ncbi:zinc transporter permease [Arthrobacter sp. Bz4]|uniref:zinc transporter permease n=1 Tax=Arthrobacter sp. Bz4 TaxID=2171979 RepID=UPI0014020163|nr:zinc transporter permease [Arthrobacter sp. Bz4]